MSLKKRIRRIVGDEPQSPAERVLKHCGKDHVDCKTYLAGALRMAVFLQNHPEEEDPEQGSVKIRIAYTNFHPRPISLKREHECNGGVLAAYDAEQSFKLMVGRSSGESRSTVVPDGVGVTRGLDGTQIDTRITFADPSPVANPADGRFSVVFPDEGELQCSCC